MRNFTPQDLGLNKEQLNISNIRDQLDIEQLVYRQILATQQAASIDDNVFAANVEVLACYLPITRQKALEDRFDEFTIHDEHLEWKINCGVRINNPALGSPYLVSREVIDYRIKFKVILQILEEIGMTWKVDDLEREIAKPKEKKPPTPLTQNIYNAEIPQEIKSTEKKNAQKCWIPTCRDPINADNPGLHKYGHLICKKCEMLADVKYGTPKQ